MRFKNKASPIFINSWKLLLKNLNKIETGDILILEEPCILNAKQKSSDYLLFKKIRTFIITLIINKY